VLLVDLLLAAGAAMLAAGAYRKRRVVAIAGCGCVAAAVFVFAYGRASAAVAATTVGPSELARARRVYFERTIHRSLPRQLRVARELRRGWSRGESPAWFGRPRLGLFIHYGPTTLLGESSDRRWWRAVDAGRFDAAARTFEPDHG
jgi:hypothetical protein